MAAAFRGRWLNELVFWVASLIYLEPLSDGAVPRAGQAERGDPPPDRGLFRTNFEVLAAVLRRSPHRGDAVLSRS